MTKTNRGTFLSRRAFLNGSACAIASAAAACTTTSPSKFGTSVGLKAFNDINTIGTPAFYASAYAPKPQERFPLPGIGYQTIDTAFLRQEVDYKTQHRAGTIIVSPKKRLLHFVLPEGKAIRYGVGVGRQGFAWSGNANVGFKRAWPTWTPPAEMIAREPRLEKYRHGMEPGLGNPLGARAIYIFKNGRDTLYRIHGTNEPQSIGKAVSSGCIRMFNQDVIDLHDRVYNGAKVVVEA